MDLSPDFRDLLEELALGAVEFALVGGYAVAFHGRPRATKDIDILIGPAPGNLERAASALERFGAPPDVARAVRSMSDDEIVYLGQPPMRIDLLRTIDGVGSSDVLRDAVHAVVDGLHVRVISLDHLVTNKRAAGRPQDLEDVRFFERVAAART